MAVNVSEAAPVSEWKPRSRSLVIGGLPWLARMTDKARAKVEGTIGDYIYPCPLDQRVLAELGLSADEFAAIVTEHDTDTAVVGAVKDRLAR